MDEARPDDPAPAPDSPRPKRNPPTIDLKASEKSEQSGSEGRDSHAKGRLHTKGRLAGSLRAAFSRFSTAAIYPLLTAAMAGAVGAALVMAIVWTAGWLRETTQPVAQAQTDASAIETLSLRLAELEGRNPQLAAPASEAAASARFDAVEKSLTSLRAENSAAASRASPDLAAIEERLNQLERASGAENDRGAPATGKPADDVALRRAVVASMLDISVRQSEPFAAMLAAAKALASDPDALKPLEVFAATGVPNAASLTRELLTLVPRLSPPAPEKSTTGTGIVDRLQAGASKLVRIERTDATGHDRDAVVARITAAAVRNDLPEARRELEQLAAADRAAANGWLDKLKARDMALAASHHFVMDAMTAFTKPAP